MKKIFAAIFAIMLVSGVFLMAMNSRKNSIVKEPNPVEIAPSESSTPADFVSSDTFFVRGESVDWICDGNTPIIEPEGSTFILKSVQVKQGEPVMENPPLSLGYSGELKITVNHSEIYSTLEEAGIDWNDAAFEEESVKKWLNDPRFVLIDLELENVDAANTTAVQYIFSASMFDLMGQDDFAPPNNTNPDYNSLADESVFGRFYFSAHADGEKDYYSFMLEPGQTLPMQLGFFVERKFVEEQELYLKLGTIRNNLCGIALQPVEK